jgi:hypothetical protein
MAKEKLNPPLIANKLNAQAGDNIVIPFTMNKSVGLAQVDNLVILVKTVSTGAEVGTYTCNKGSLYFKDNYYYATFEGIGQYLQIG